MTRSTKLWLWLGGTVAAIAAGLGIYEETKKPATTSAPPGPAGAMVLQPNTRYLVTITSTTPIATPLTIPKVVAAFPGSVAVPTTGPAPSSGINVVAVNTALAGTKQTNYTIDTFTPAAGAISLAQLAAPYTGSPGSLPTTLQVTVASLGPVPAYGGGVGSINLTPPQSVTISASGAPVQAKAVTGGTLNISAPWAIYSISPSPTYSGTPSTSGSSTSLVLTGQKGVLTIFGYPPQGSTTPPSVTVSIG